MLNLMYKYIYIIPLWCVILLVCFVIFLILLELGFFDAQKGG